MTQQDGAGVGDQREAVLLTIAHQLRDVAVRANRSDIAAKAEEAIVLLGGSGASFRPDVGQRADKDSGNPLERILNGLGF